MCIVNFIDNLIGKEQSYTVYLFRALIILTILASLAILSASLGATSILFYPEQKNLAIAICLMPLIGAFLTYRFDKRAFSFLALFSLTFLFVAYSYISIPSFSISSIFLLCAIGFSILEICVNRLANLSRKG